MFKAFTLILIILLSFLSVQTNTKKLLFVQELFRHGARNPASQTKNDLSNISQQWRSMGQLTSEGKNMHYLLGKALYEKYWMLLFGGTPYEKQLNQSKIFVKSTNYNRTIQSAQAQIFGLLENLPPITLTPQAFEFSSPPWPNLNLKKPTENWQVFASSKSFHTLPIHIENKGANYLNRGDFLLRFDDTNCPHQFIWQKQNFQSQRAIKIMQLKEVKEAMQAMQKAIGINIPFDIAYKYIDNYFCLKYMGQKYLPVFQDPQYKRTFDFIKTISLYLGFFYLPIQRKVSSSEFFDETFLNFRKIIEDPTGVQLVLYSAHDTTVSAALSFLDMANVDCVYDFYINKVNNSDVCISNYPPFASNLIFQLWEDNKVYTIKILFNGQERKLPFCDMKKECQYQRFESWYKSVRSEDVNNECGIYNSESGLYLVIIILSIVVGLLIAYLIYQKKHFILRSFKKERKYNEQFQEKEVEVQQP